MRIQTLKILLCFALCPLLKPWWESERRTLRLFDTHDFASVLWNRSGNNTESRSSSGESTSSVPPSGNAQRADRQLCQFSLFSFSSPCCRDAAAQRWSCTHNPVLLVTVQFIGSFFWPLMMISSTWVRSIILVSISMMSGCSLAPLMNSSSVNSP